MKATKSSALILLMLFASTAFAKPGNGNGKGNTGGGGGIVLPDPKAYHVLYVDFGDSGLDNTPNWGQSPYLFHPGVTPKEGFTESQQQTILAVVRQARNEASINLDIQEYAGQTLKPGVSMKVVVGGDLLWNWMGQPSSGWNFAGFFYSAPYAYQRAFSTGYYFGHDPYYTGLSVVLEGIAGGAGIPQDLSRSGYAYNFLYGTGWTSNNVSMLQSIYGFAMPGALALASIGPAYSEVPIVSPGWEIPETPEPSILWLAGVGMLMLKRRRAH